jgi:FkbM family methyltransferase
MTFVSYAQNLEDVMLWRALKDIEKGFYIDVGANDPVVDSVTKAFYERGWRGINVEPLPSHWRDLTADRPEDINLQCAAGESKGELRLWETDVRGWATASREVIEKHRSDGHEGEFHTVPVLRLADICADHVTGDIHFLKIDVEGFEKSVISGMDFTRFRPWIVVVEATVPNSMIENYQDWESIVLSNAYTLAYADGLNRFYIAQERLDRLERQLRYPPNTFDDYIRIQQQNSEYRAQQAETRAQQFEVMAQASEARAQASEARAQASEARARQSEYALQQTQQDSEYRAQQAEAKAWQSEQALQQAQIRLQAVFSSTSWRITRPLRGIKRVLSGDARPARQMIAKAVLKTKIAARPLVAEGIRFVFARPALRARLSRLLKRWPWLHRRLLRVAASTVFVHGQAGVSERVPAATNSTGESTRFPVEDAANLSPHARLILEDLKKAIARRQGGSN